MSFHVIMQIMKALKDMTNGMEKPYLWVAFCLTAMGFMIWLVTSGNGALIGIVRIFTANP